MKTQPKQNGGNLARLARVLRAGFPTAFRTATTAFRTTTTAVGSEQKKEYIPFFTGRRVCIDFGGGRDRGAYAFKKEVYKRSSFDFVHVYTDTNNEEHALKFSLPEPPTQKLIRALQAHNSPNPVFPISYLGLVKSGKCKLQVCAMPVVYTLYDVIRRRGPMPDTEVYNMAKDLATQALFLSRLDEKYIYLDIKPTNTAVVFSSEFGRNFYYFIDHASCVPDEKGYYVATYPSSDAFEPQRGLVKLPDTMQERLAMVAINIAIMAAMCRSTYPLPVYIAYDSFKKLTETIRVVKRHLRTMFGGGGKHAKVLMQLVNADTQARAGALCALAE